ncbi:MAG TPA: cyclic nucleotide-binding domain-containing protein [Streptosporangiaceae bacterium]|jgi:CRP-like cAMP-binding protein
MKAAGMVAGSAALFSGGVAVHGAAHPGTTVIALALVMAVLVPLIGFTAAHLLLLSKGRSLVRNPEDVRVLAEANARAFSGIILAFSGITAIPPATPPADPPARPMLAGRTSPGEPSVLPGATAIDDTPRCKPGTFLGALTDAEHAGLRAISEPCAYGAGEVLFREGQRAAHVVVVLSGRARVTVTRRGATTSLAERGPGELVGERAVSRLRARSATVTAVGELKGLRIAAVAFGEYLSGHARVVDVLERQLFARMTEAGPPPRLTGQNCSVLMADIVGFGDRRRTDADRSSLVDTFYEAMEGVFEQTGIAWEQCHDEDRGDGILLIVPVAVPTARVVDPLVGMLAARLRAHNLGAPKPRRIRLRMALDVGPVAENEHGVEGEAIINAARLLAAEPLVQSVARPGIDLGFIASRFVHDSVIRHQKEAKAYHEVEVRVKTYEDRAWLRVYGRRSA